MKILYFTVVAALFPIFLSAQAFTLAPLPHEFVFPVDLAYTEDGRTFVVEQRGRIKVIEADGTLNDVTFLNIGSNISFGGERGLLGVAFHPNFEENGLLYANYTNTAGTTIISSFRFEPSEIRVNVSSENILLRVAQPFGNHNGGCLKFGPDGHLYIGLGDGGAGNDPQDNAQNDQLLLGKMLRIAVEETGGYTIPEDNPFINTPIIPDEIWASGLRNPWRFSFDRATGDLWIGEVGQDSYEEINKVDANEIGGLNFGWRCLEGQEILDPRGCTDISSFHAPIYVYPTTSNIGESITGGYVYRGAAYPELQGKYIYGDYVSGKIWALQELPSGEIVNELIAQHSRNDLSSFGEDIDGELFITGHQSGKVYRLTKNVATNSPSMLDVSTLSITPNPFGNKIRIQLETQEAQAIVIQLRNLKGQQIKESSINLQLGKNIFSFDTTTLPKGSYILSMTDGKDTISKTLIKL